MFWKRTSGHGAFFGLLAGTAAAAMHHGLTVQAGELRKVVVEEGMDDASAGWPGLDCDLRVRRLLLVTVAVSLATLQVEST